MGNLDEQRKNFIKPPMNLPASRSPRRTPPPSSATPPANSSGSQNSESVELPKAQPKVTGRGGQFRALPRFGRRDESREEQAVDPAEDEIDAEWGDRFEARHAPPNSRKRPAQRDEPRRSAARSYPDDSWQSRGQPAYDDGWDDDASEYAPARPQRDPWRRDWVQWTSMDLNVDDIMGYPGDEFDGGWSRDAWGGGPNPHTMASVALHVELPPPPGKGRASKPALQQFMYWAQRGFKATAKPTKKAMRALTIMAVVSVLLLTSVGTGLTGLVDYLSLKGYATDAVSSLSHLGDDLGLGKHKTQMTDAQRSAAATADVQRALNDMQQLHDRLAQPDIVLAMAGKVGKVRAIIDSGLVLSQVGIEAINMLQTMLPTLVSLAKVISSSPISTDATSQDNTPLLYDSDVQKIIANIDQIKPQLEQIISVLQATPPQTLVAALNTKQQGEILPLLQGLPYLKQALPILQEFLGLKSAGTLLGIDHGPVAYLLMTLDNSEIRPAGGFQGQYALIGVNGGRISHIALQDTYHYLEPLTYSGPLGTRYWVYDDLPLASESWYPTDLGWAMRNSGLSPDFPQSARYALWYLHNEETCTFDNPKQVAGQNGIYCNPPCPVGASSDNGVYKCMPGGDRLPMVDAKGQVDGFQPNQIPMAGVIMIQSNIIAQLLQITGPLKIGCPYNTTVDSSNLEQKIHFYQETYRGKNIGSHSCPTQVSDSTKRFTGLLTQVLQQKLKDLPKSKLLQFVGDIVQDLHNKQIQMFFTDPVHPGNIGPSAFANGYDPAHSYPEQSDAEKFLRKYQVSSELYHQGNDDSLTLNRADVVGWKFEPFVHVKLIDHITINANGSATHDYQTEYDITVPRIKFFPKPGQVLSNLDPLVQNAVFNVVYNAAFSNRYLEIWRLYMSGKAIPQLGPGQGFISAQSGAGDVSNRSYVMGNYLYQWNYDSQTNLIDWGPYGGSVPPALSWVVPGAVENGHYILHVQPQSGVDTSAQIVITLPNNKICNEMNGGLPQNKVISVNVKAGTC